VTLRRSTLILAESVPDAEAISIETRQTLPPLSSTWRLENSPPVTRGIYVLYREGPERGKKKTFEVFYIGIGGVSKNAHTGVGGRVKHHDKSKSKRDKWTHYSFFEVHDNISREEILELEGLFLRIFWNDPRIKLANVQLGLKTLKRLSKDSAWPKAKTTK
jgi:hypothetical protein